MSHRWRWIASSLGLLVIGVAVPSHATVDSVNRKIGHVTVQTPAAPVTTATPTLTATPTPTVTPTRTPNGCATPGEAMFGIGSNNEPLCVTVSGCGGRIVIFNTSYVWADSQLLYYTGAG
jgi:hypothetical protein